jgi:hypothetical protein
VRFSPGPIWRQCAGGPSRRRKLVEKDSATKLCNELCTRIQRLPESDNLVRDLEAFAKNYIKEHYFALLTQEMKAQILTSANKTENDEIIAVIKGLLAVDPSDLHLITE